MITMTWPQYRRQQCAVEGFVLSLSAQETELLATLLLRYPNPVTIQELIVEVYPDPWDEPEYPEGQIVQRMMHLARKVGMFRIVNGGRTIGYRLIQHPGELRRAA